MDRTATRRAAYLLASFSLTLAGCALGNSPRSTPTVEPYAATILTVTTLDIRVTLRKGQTDVLLNPPYNVEVRTTNVVRLDLLSTDNVSWRLPTSSDPAVLTQLSVTTFSDGHLAVLYRASTAGIAQLHVVLPCTAPDCAALGIIVTVIVGAGTP